MNSISVIPSDIPWISMLARQHIGTWPSLR
ncbi:unnamed protein product [Spirodela intermedia]|uniref:Uncharacterized protein n=1 Tax=Spirodela intermedia TaxID=51605 RepID=A0A7I8IQH0_SPIIN|nr:unnamed protein product [Spirodela intermedia]CAA6660159.1 unnamed protein product [Spirodela intermedia]